MSVEIKPSERFERRGDDLYCTVKVDALQAILGTTVSVDGVMADEKVQVEVPAGCQFGQQVVAERRGMPRMGMIARGDLVAVVQVEIPTDLTKKQLLTVSTLVAERGLGDAADSAGEKLRDRAEKVKDEIEEEVSEHFSGDKWRAPKNPFTGKRK